MRSIVKGFIRSNFTVHSSTDVCTYLVVLLYIYDKTVHCTLTVIPALFTECLKV